MNTIRTMRKVLAFERRLGLVGGPAIPEREKAMLPPSQPTALPVAEAAVERLKLNLKTGRIEEEKGPSR